MTTIASLLVTIGADISDLKRGLQDSDTQIDRFAGGFSSRLTTIGADITRLGAGIDTLGAPLRDFGAVGLQTASDFDSVMAEISARTGVVGTDLDAVRQFALDMGADTAFSAQQAGEAFLQLLSSGQSTEQAFQTLPSILDAAAASGEDLGATADSITDIMAAFGVGIEYSGDVVDTLAQAAGASSADMASLGQGFANVGGVARTFGLSVADTAATLAVFAENGIKGAEAGTTLKSLLLNMSRDTEDVQGAWESLGLSMYDSQGNMRDWESIITDLDTALDDMPLEEQNRYMQTLAGSYGIVGLTALRGKLSIQDMRAAMLMQAGASEIAATRMATFEGRMDSLWGSVQSLMITALTPLMNDVLSPLAEQVTELINGVTDWAEANPELTSTLVAIGGALAFAGPLLIGIGTAMTLAAPAVAVLGAVFAALVSPIALVAAGLAGIAYVATQFIDFGALADTIRTGIGTALDSANIDLSNLPTRISDAIATLDFTATVSDLETKITGVLLSGLNIAVPTLDLSSLETSVTDSFSALDFSGVNTVMDTHFNDILNGAITVAGLVFGGPVGLAIGGARLVSSAIESDFLGIGTFLDNSGITAAVEGAFNDVKATIDGLISSVFGGGGEANDVDIVGQFAERTGTSLESGGAALSGPLATFVSDLRLGFDALKGLASDVWANIGPGITDLGEGLQGFISNLSGTETDGLLRVVTAVTGFIGGIAGVAIELGSEILGELMTAIGDALPEIGSAISNFITGISRIGEGDFSGAVQSIADGLIDFGQAILDFLGIDIQIPSFDEALAGFRTAFEAIPIIFDEVKANIERGVNDFASGIRGVFRDIEQLILDIQMKTTDVQIGLGINYDANVAFKEQLQQQFNASNLAETLEGTLAGGMANGEGITIDPSQFVGVDYAALASKIANPMLIQDAINMALGEGDEAALGVLLPLATSLGIDTQSLIDQYQAGLDAAAAQAQLETTVNAAVIVNPTGIDLSPVLAGIQAAASGVQMQPGQGSGGATANAAVAALPHLDTGGYIQKEGLAYLHAGEVVLNQGQQANQGRGGNNVTFAPTMSVDYMISELERMGIYLRPGMNGG